MLARLAFVIALLMPALAAAETAFDFAFRKLEGGELPLSAYRGKALLVVNTASFCGFTSQYEGMVTLWNTYRDRGLVVIGVPSNDFNQEPGNAGDIREFCDLTYGVDFPMADKEQVSGPGAHPFYAWAAATFGADKVPSWNFHKYLISPEGQIVAAYSGLTGPTAGSLTDAIEMVLPRP
ncbi:glutathione peroxidase [Zavarzinia compransoris]|uniref:Glutathione peroxidase n=1 Tax=Zavarzinia compransoris TaxID=1264899 RepID=A0A317E0C9_9PROT|nr:glutathione peroxidase [Zavarzinia compransoris]PWR19586.1 glutathione peroxidase [Zavarzinia compransoris]TDP40430.1 glutathione peroxidase [Zavarzinia compransoris]